MFNINDKNLINDINNEFSQLIGEEENKISEYCFEHPLDEEARKKLKALIIDGKDSIEYSQVGQLDKLWIMLINKAIKCLRFFDEREPFLSNNNKTPVAYGIDKLEAYHDRYSSFESLLYGASSYYRDHVFHSMRTWMLGVFCLLKPMTSDKEIFINQITIDGCSDDIFSSNINFFEKISMWTFIALCHDLGYPLEKSQQILDKTQKMMKEFIPNPNIWNNFGFSVACKYGCEYTVYVDDMTFSAKEPFDINRMKNEVDCILRKYGHKPKYKKVKYYSKGKSVPITGTIVTGQHELKVPNRLQKRVYDDFQELKYLGGKELSDIEIRKLNSLKGRILASRNIEEGKFPEINRLTNLIS